MRASFQPRIPNLAHLDRPLQFTLGHLPFACRP
jgi:hypothetical protein